MRIVIVDNDFFELHSLKRVIRKKLARGTEIKGFRCPRQALQYVREYSVDVVFLNMAVSQIHGLVVAQKLQEINPRINLIFMSEEGAYLSEAWKIHVSDYLIKPIKPERLEQSLSNLRYAAIC